MRRLPWAPPAPGKPQWSLPAVVEQLLVEVATDGFTLYCCGARSAPHALLATYTWAHYVDLLTIADFDRVTTARVPIHAGMDLFAPEVVVWAYESPPQPALRALLELVHPDHPQAPTTAFPAPARLRVPRTHQRPMIIQLPTPARAGVRATRLAIPITTVDDNRAVSGLARAQADDLRLVAGGAGGPRR
ncbi:MAG: hypothetical protein ACRDRX_16840 [Pseudonocardiaceae bacterium]